MDRIQTKIDQHGVELHAWVTKGFWCRACNNWIDPVGIDRLGHKKPQK